MNFKNITAGDDLENRLNTDIDPSDFFSSEKMDKYQKPFSSEGENVEIMNTA